jgi:hypothetical protein
MKVFRTFPQHPHLDRMFEQRYGRPLITCVRLGEEVAEEEEGMEKGITLD